MEGIYILNPTKEIVVQAVVSGFAVLRRQNHLYR